MDHIQQNTPAAPAQANTRKYIVALVIGDIITFLVFAALGRRSHGEAAGLAAWFEVVQTAAPFILGWFIVAPFVGAYRLRKNAERRTPNDQSVALSVPAMLQQTTLAWLAAWPLGLVLRALFLQRGIPVSFAIVTLLTNMVLLGGWRAVFAWLALRRNG